MTTPIIVAAGHAIQPMPADARDPLGYERSPEWGAVRRHFLSTHPTCSVCGVTHDLEVHHVEPFHLNPTRELDETNLLTLCRPHHFLFGHLMRWESANVSVRQDTEAWRQKILHRPA